MPSNPDPALEAARSDRSFFGHPRGMTEMFERFSYYGMRAILILYMVAKIEKGGLGFADQKAGSVYGLYAAMVYLLCLGGGWIADRITGQRKAVLIGGIFIAAGEFSLVVPGEAFFYLGLVLLMAGTGMLKGNVSTIVGQLYPQGDPRRDSGFSIFYMGINIGALISPLICGYVGERISWRLGFGVAGLGMLIGVIQYVVTAHHLGNAGLKPASTGDPERDQRERKSAIVGVSLGVGVLVLLGVMAAMGVIVLSPTVISDGLGWCLLGITVVVFSWLIFFGDWSAVERKRCAAILVLFVASALFWAAFEQAGSSLNLFAERLTNCNLFGFDFPASWYQTVQPIFVIALAPVFAVLWLKLGKKEPPAPGKFMFGLLFGGLAFLVLVPAATMTLGGGKAGPWWLIGTYFLQTLGELCLSPVGLSAMSKLAPARAGGFMMGIWFLSTSIGNWLAGRAVTVSASMSLPTMFGSVGWFSIGAAVVLGLLIKPTVRLMQGVK
jgi:POT family proton-dependent oligopeptide transporter